ncbi:hypothetical protein SB748_37055, partial [Rhizobium sp. SIMBA_035]
ENSFEGMLDRPVHERRIDSETRPRDCFDARSIPKRRPSLKSAHVSRLCPVCSFFISPAAFKYHVIELSID